MKRKKYIIDIQNKVEYFLFRSAILIIGIFPYSWVRMFCRNLFLFAGYYLGVRKKIAHTQMCMVYPEKSETEIRQLLKKTYKNLGITIAEIYFAPQKKLAEECKMDHLEYLTDALAEGKGAIICTGHFGNWELAMHVLSLHGIVMAGVTKRMRNPYFDDYTYKWRQQSGLEIIYKDEAGRNMIKALKANKAVVLLIDQDAGKDGIVMDFLGHPASTFKGAAKIAMHGNIPVVSAYLIRNEDGSSTAQFFPPTLPSTYPKTDEGVAQMTKDISQILEDQILLRPYLWFWLHRRWKGAHKVNKARQRELRVKS
jgi:Kdo2-lipid IVA lauroyltransferase/acyltransferase